MIKEAYDAGTIRANQEIEAELEKIALSDQALAGIAGTMPGLIGNIAAPTVARDGLGWPTAVGQITGQTIAGIGSGMAAKKLGKSAKAQRIAQRLGGMAGDGAGTGDSEWEE